MGDSGAVNQPFTWAGDAVAITLGADEARLLADLPAILAALSTDPSAADRLHPAAYRDDDEAQGEYRRLMAGELTRARADDRDVFAETLRSGSYTVTPGEAETWLRVIGDARIGLAARRGVVEGHDAWEHEVGIDADLTLVAWLGFLQASLVEALAGALPDG